jgi:acetate---CoA ligase (ADP-forming)
VLHDVSLRVLPVDADEVSRMLAELRGAPLLHGARGSRPADLGALASSITQIAAAALSLGPSLRSLEVNPLWVDGERIEALDILVVTGQGSMGHGSTGQGGMDQNNIRTHRERNGRP